MIYTILKYSLFTSFLVILLSILYSKESSEFYKYDPISPTETRNLSLDLKETGVKIQPTMYGIFFEDINFAADGGLYAELVKNRSFEFTLPKMGWFEPNTNFYTLNSDSGSSSVIKYSGDNTNKNFLRITINDAGKYQLINEGYRGMGVKNGESYRLTLMASKFSGSVSSIIVELITPENEVITKQTIPVDSDVWNNYETILTPEKTEAKAKLRMTFEGSGELDLDMISLFPVNTWLGRTNGLRKDIVELLDELNPGFLRFPGGCIVEGRILDRRYQWKKTIGPVGDREILVNRWNTEFAHRPAPDYYQSFGIGFFEYFQLAEDLGAEPLPILSCGMACQFNTGELVPIDELDPYVQDALDLIEFANGDLNSQWGKKRLEMGHPEPFNLKYIGVGNEQWGPDYIERYKVFEKAIKAKYPKIIIVSGSGPFSDGEFFDYGMKELKKLNAELIDEHYYKPPQWFLDNAARYDKYDRNGPKIFAGEYAAHPREVEDGPLENNWEGALAEAAFMTGLERNADVVHLTSYAPLMAHKDAFQWAPDLIWFDNLESYGTPNYYVQKLYANNRGTDLLRITENGTQLSGQDGLYGSAVKDVINNTIIIKLVNTSNQLQSLMIDSKGGKFKKEAEKIVLHHDDGKSSNSFEKHENIVPKSSKISLSGRKFNLELEPKSFTIIKINI